jgi:methionyl-tRNA synthetase
MIAKNCGGRIPEWGAPTGDDKLILAEAYTTFDRVQQDIDDFAIHRALETIWTLIANGNRYFASQEPWARRKDDPARADAICSVVAEVLRQIAIMVQPVMPDSAAKLLDQLGVPADARDFAALGPKGRLKPGTELPPPQAVFPRHVEAEPTPAA